jgi:hypothetical protein
MRRYSTDFGPHATRTTRLKAMYCLCAATNASARALRAWVSVTAASIAAAICAITARACAGNAPARISAAHVSAACSSSTESSTSMASCLSVSVGCRLSVSGTISLGT